MTKKMILAVLSAVTVICAVFAMFFLTTTSCSNSRDNQLTTDSIKFDKAEKSIDCHFVADYPVKGNQGLTLMVREWISEQMGGTYKGSYENGDSVVQYYGKAALDTLRAFAKEMSGDSPDMKLESTMSIRKSYETPKFVTYIASSYSYMGGAHGGATLEGATFRKSDGRKFGWDMFRLDSRFTKVQQLIKEGLKQYFKVKTDEELKSNLLNPDNIYLLPLPQAAPYFTKEGITFVYGQYEIACYAAGMPTFTVPYSKAEGLLTQAAVSLL